MKPYNQQIKDYVHLFRKERSLGNLFAFVITEGINDQYLYQRFIAGGSRQILVAGNKANAIQTLTALEEESVPGVLAIVDANSMILDKVPITSPNLFLTDGHDVEIMILGSPALDYVLVEYGSEAKIVTFVQERKMDVRTALLECALPIGCLRVLSLRENWGLKFEDLDFEKFTEKSTLVVDTQKMVRYVRSYTASTSSPPKINLTDSDICAKIQQLMSAGHDPRHLCCGHDVIAILTLGLRKALGTSKNAEIEHIAIGLRLAYGHLLFAKTLLYGALHTWEKCYTPFVALDSEFKHMLSSAL